MSPVDYPLSERPPSSYQIFVATMAQAFQRKCSDIRADLSTFARTVSETFQELNQEQRDQLDAYAARISANWESEKYKWRKHPGKPYWVQVDAG